MLFLKDCTAMRMCELRVNLRRISAGVCESGVRFCLPNFMSLQNNTIFMSNFITFPLCKCVHSLEYSIRGLHQCKCTVHES